MYDVNKYKIIAVTNRKLCCENFLQRIEKLAKSSISTIILREKDLSESEYTELAEKVIRICCNYNKPCILHTHINSAIKLGAMGIHLPFSVFEKEKASLGKIQTVGVSVHSEVEAEKAQALGASYITAGHIFQTSCKPDLKPRGLGFCKAVCNSVKMPVFAIGGISDENAESVMKAGASGICIMSGLMQCGDVDEYLAKFKLC